MPEPLIIVFLKAPRPGAVKTRLAQSIGPEAACQAYIEMCRSVLETLRDFNRVQIRFTPDDAHQEIQQLLQPGWNSAPQGNGNLGDRIERAFQETVGPAILIGTDCPAIEASDLDESRSALDSHPIVIGPARDGGYWLIGMREYNANLFRGINWSTQTVFEETMARAEQANLSVYSLRQLSDIDTEADWKEWSG